MKAAELARLVSEIQASSLSDAAKALALDGLPKTRLEQGNRHLEILHHLRRVIGEGFSQAYAYRMTALLYDVDERYVRKLHSEQFRGETDPFSSEEEQSEWRLTGEDSK